MFCPSRLGVLRSMERHVGRAEHIMAHLLWSRNDLGNDAVRTFKFQNQEPLNILEQEKQELLFRLLLQNE
jgi:hypothetical protein